MPYPFRMNRVILKIRILNVAATKKDNVYKEAFTVKNRDEIVTLEGQSNVNFGVGLWFQQSRAKATNLSMTGDEPSSMGRLIFKEKELEAQGILVDDQIRIKKDDQIIEVAGHPTDFIITEVRPMAPLRGRGRRIGRTRLVAVMFTTNEEVR